MIHNHKHLKLESIPNAWSKCDQEHWIITELSEGCWHISNLITLLGRSSGMFIPYSKIKSFRHNHPEISVLQKPIYIITYFPTQFSDIETLSQKLLILKSASLDWSTWRKKKALRRRVDICYAREKKRRDLDICTMKSFLSISRERILI